MTLVLKIACLLSINTTNLLILNPESFEDYISLKSIFLVTDNQISYLENVQIKVAISSRPAKVNDRNLPKCKGVRDVFDRSQLRCECEVP